MYNYSSTIKYLTIDQYEFEIEYNKSLEWLKLITQQVIHNNGKLIVELDHNDANLSLISAQFVLNTLKKRTSFAITNVEILFFILYVIVIIFGTITNSLMLFAFCRSDKLRTIRNTFIINLAISDILLCSICAPLTIIRIFNSKWYIGRLLCKLGPGLQTANVLTSAFSIAAIAADRYQFIVYPGNDTTRKIGAFGCSLIIWSIALLLSIPSFVVNDVTMIKWKHNHQLIYTLCQETWYNLTYKYFYCTFIAIVHFLLPFVIVCITNFQICLFLEYHVPSIYTLNKRKSQILIHSLSERGQKSQAADQKFERVDSMRNSTVSINYEQNSLISDHKKYNHIKKLLFIVALSFALCWLPLVILNFIADADSAHLSQEHFSVVLLVFHLLAMTSTCVNPLLYGILNTNFKEELISIIIPKLNAAFKFTSNNQNMSNVAVNLFNEYDNDIGTLNYGTTTKSSRLISKTSLFNTNEDEKTNVLNYKNRHKSLSTEFFKPRPYYSIYKIDEESSNYNSSIVSKRNSISNSELNTNPELKEKNSYFDKLLSPNYVFTLHASLRKKTDSAKLTTTNTAPAPIHLSVSSTNREIKNTILPRIVVTADITTENENAFKYVDSEPE